MLTISSDCCTSCLTMTGRNLWLLLILGTALLSLYTSAYPTQPSENEEPYNAAQGSYYWGQGPYVGQEAYNAGQQPYYARQGPYFSGQDWYYDADELFQYMMWDMFTDPPDIEEAAPQPGQAQPGAQLPVEVTDAPDMEETTPAGQNVVAGDGGAQAHSQTQATGVTETEEPPEIENEETTPAGTATDAPDIDIEEQTTAATTPNVTKAPENNTVIQDPNIVTSATTNAPVMAAALEDPVVKSRIVPDLNVIQNGTSEDLNSTSSSVPSGVLSEQAHSSGNTTETRQVHPAVDLAGQTNNTTSANPIGTKEDILLTVEEIPYKVNVTEAQDGAQGTGQ